MSEISTAILIYREQYLGLVNRREQIIMELERINNELSQVIRKAKSENIDVVKLSIVP